jgi:hypothetical protein
MKNGKERLLAVLYFVGMVVFEMFHCVESLPGAINLVKYSQVKQKDGFDEQ